MQSRKKALFLCLIVIIATLSLITSLRGQNQNKVSDNEQKKFDKEEFKRRFPVVDYNVPEPADPDKLAKRRKKSKKYDNSTTPINPFVDVITSTVDWASSLSALPVDKSHIIVVGEVIDAQAYLSNDKTSVYSEFTIRIDKTLMNRCTEILTTGNSLLAEREGGRVRMPDGHDALYWVVGQNMPQVGRRYLLFLRASASGQDFFLLTGYELRAGRVFPLDNPGGGTHPLATTYNDADESSLLRDVQAAIANSTKP